MGEDRTKPVERILIADGDLGWREMIRDCLEGPGIEIESSAGGEEALAAARQNPPHLIVTELSLPDISGLGLCRLIREDPLLADLGVVMVTARATEIDRVLAFEAGVDDFLGKPFFGRELASRTRAVLRRLAKRNATAQGSRCDSQDLGSRLGLRDLKDLRPELTPREHALLVALVGESGRTVSRRRLLAMVWRRGEETTERVVDAHIKSIRRKLGEARDCVETVRGVGYRFNERFFDRTGPGGGGNRFHRQ